ncbi:MAG: hypothetical protein ABF617_12710, partial [Gluconobacter japonicus]
GGWGWGGWGLGAAALGVAAGMAIENAASGCPAGYYLTQYQGCIPAEGYAVPQGYYGAPAYDGGVPPYTWGY